MKKQSIVPLLSLLLLITVSLTLFSYKENFNDQFQKIDSKIINVESTPQNSVMTCWNVTWGTDGSDYAYGSANDSMGNIFICGVTYGTGTGQGDVFVVKYNPEGIFQWERIWGGSLEESAYHIAIDSNDNPVIVGYITTGSGLDDMLILKYSSDGTFQFSRTWGYSHDDGAESVVIGSDDSIYLTGYTDTGDGQYSDVVLVKYDTNGNQVYNRTWGWTYSEVGYGIDLDSAENIFITGYTSNFGAGSSDVVLIKYDLNGNLQWNKTWGTSGSNCGNEIFLNSDNEIYIACENYNYTTYLIKFDGDGIAQWIASYTGPYYTSFEDVITDSNGYIYGIGSTYPQGSTSYTQLLIVKFNQNNQIWNFTWGGDRTENGYGLSIDSNNDLYIAGYTSSFTDDGSSDVFLMKLTESFYLSSTATTPDIDGKFLLFWENASYVDNYSIYIYSDFISEINESVSLVAKGLTNSSYWIVDALNGTYFYIIQAQNLTLNRTTNCIQIQVSCFPPEPFQLFWTNQFDSDGCFDLTWSPSQFAHNYSLYRSNKSISNIDETVEFIVNGLTTRSYHYEDLLNGTFYIIIVACNQYGNRSSNCLPVIVRRNLLVATVRGATSTNDYYMHGTTADSFGNIYYVGTEQYPTGSSPPINTKMLLLKYNYLGEFLWFREYGAGSWSRGYGVKTDSNDNVYIAGSVASDLALVKYTSDGTFQWARTRFGANIDDFKELAIVGTDVYCMGTTSTWGAGSVDTILMKYDTSGNYQWNVTWGGAKLDVAWDMVMDSSHNMYVAGMTNSTLVGGINDLFIVKFDTAGNQLWNITWGSASYSEGKQYEELGISLDSANNIYIAATQDNTYNTYMLLVKFDSIGNHQWNTTWESSGYSYYFYDVEVDRFDYIYATGLTNTGSDVLLSMYNSTGSCLWNQTYGTASETNRGMAITIANDSLFIGVSSINGSSGVETLTLLKYTLIPEYFNLTSDANTPDTNGAFNLSWEKSDNAHNYSVYYSTSYITQIDGSVSLFASGITDVNYLCTGIQNGPNYFMVVAYNNYGNMTSNCTRVDVSLAPPGSFTLSSTANNPDLDGCFNLTWTSAFEGDNVSLFYSHQYITEFNETVILLDSGLMNFTYIFTNQPLEKWYFKAVYINAFGNTSSNCVFVNVSNGPPGPFAMSSNVESPFEVGGNFDMYWITSETAKNYSVYYSTDSTFNENDIEIDNGLTDLSYHLDGFASFTSLYLIIRAKNDYGMTFSSNYLNTYVYPGGSAKPGFYTITTTAQTLDSDGNFTVSWGSSSGATSYSLYRCNNFFSNVIDGTCSLIVSGNTNRSMVFANYDDGTYYFRAVAFNANGNRTSKCIQVSIQKVYSAPDPFTLNSNATNPDIDGIFGLEWTSATFATDYSIYTCTSWITEFNGTVIPLGTGITTQSFSIVGLTNGTYYYIVVAFNSYGNSTSNCLCITVEHLSPSSFTLSSSAGSPDGDGNYLLSWTTASWADNYTVYSSTQFIDEINGTLTSVSNGWKSLSYSITSQLEGTYNYIIVAFNGNGNITSNCITIQVKFSPPKAFTLTSNATSPDTDGKLLLSWTMATDMTNYSIYQGTEPITEITSNLILIKAGLTNQSYILTGLQNGTYYYIVVAYNKAGLTKSNCINVEVAIPPPIPSSNPTPDTNPPTFLDQYGLYLGVGGAISVIVIGSLVIRNRKLKQGSVKSDKTNPLSLK